MSLALHPNSQKKLAVVQAELPESLLLTGKPGVGLGAIARNLAGSSLTGFIQPLDIKGQISSLAGTISVDEIRDLYTKTRSKITAKRVIIIDDAERLSPGAQAAFLKLLEEPTAKTHFILTSHNPQSLKSTIRSRLQTVTIEPLTTGQTKKYIDDLGISDATKRRQLDFLAAGLPAELRRLISDDDYFKSKAEIMTDTRDFLTKPIYHKLLVANKYSKDRAAALDLIDSALALTRRSLNEKPQPNLVTQLDRLLETRSKVATGCNIRLQLASLAL